MHLSTRLRGTLSRSELLEDIESLLDLGSERLDVLEEVDD